MTSVAAPHFVIIIVSLSGLIVIDGTVTAAFQSIGSNVIVAGYLSRLIVVDRTITTTLQAIGTDVITSGWDIHDDSHLENTRLGQIALNARLLDEGRSLRRPQEKCRGNQKNS